MFHSFHSSITDIPLPERFTYPFCYTPHPLCVLAAEEVQAYLARHTDLQAELEQGKMFGVLVVQTAEGEVGYLAAFSGMLAGRNVRPFFVPPVYDLQQPEGFFKREEALISQINERICRLEEGVEYHALLSALSTEEVQMRQQLSAARQRLKAEKAARAAYRQTKTLTEAEEARLIRESQHQKAEYKRLERHWKERLMVLQQQAADCEAGIEALKAERRQRSAALQRRLFEQFRLLNARGEVCTLCDIFEHELHKVPPAGAGECAAPKLLQYAYLHGWKPLAMAEFWWGASPKAEIREHGHYYPSCKGKCQPILRHMLQGLSVDPNPLEQDLCVQQQLDIVYEDRWLLVVNKPAGMLSVPGREAVGSVYDRVRERCPEADGPLIVHRLDMATSGLLLMAKTGWVHKHLQAQFAARQVSKRYVAWLDGVVSQDRGTIDLPLAPDLLDRPRQMVDREHGKQAITDYEVLERRDHHTRIALYPRTGRTHQLRVHAAHPDGLHCPIVGDTLYGTPADRLYLHAESLAFVHPATGETVRLSVEALKRVIV